jgi:Transglycosylase SLT domain
MRSILIIILLLVYFVVPAQSRVVVVQDAGCRQAIVAAEQQTHLPPQLLGTIALVESGRVDPRSGQVEPWPWAINVEGVGHFYESKADAIDAVAKLQALGVQSIDVGCMQINLQQHPGAFRSLDDAFDPQMNANYGARFLSALYRQTNSWSLAIAFYHSQTPEIGAPYANIVTARWALAGRFVELHPLGPQVTTADYSVYTGAFAAKMKQMDRDLQRLDPGAKKAGPPALEWVRSPGDGTMLADLSHAAGSSRRHRTVPLRQIADK